MLHIDNYKHAVLNNFNLQLKLHTCNFGITDPAAGGILLSEEDNVGMCLSLRHHEHSALPDDRTHLTVNPGNFSVQLKHVFTSNSANFE